jgi:hypothetical protein
MNRTKYIDCDFSEHKFYIHKTDDISVYHLKKDNTYWESIKYINTNGILAVTGDYGNWIFCREFHPGANEGASGHYWVEKLHISSNQCGMEFDSEATKNIIKQRISDLEDGENDDYSDEIKAELIEYYNDECLDYVDCSDHEYTSHAYMNHPYRMDTEDVPYCQDIKPWLKIILEGFNEMCRRIENNDVNIIYL